MMTKDKSKAPLIKTNTLDKNAKHSMLVRIISAVVGLIIVIPSIFIGNWVYFGLLGVALGFACYEILGCAQKRTVPLFIIYFIFVGVIACWPMFIDLIRHGFTAARVDQHFLQLHMPLMIFAAGAFVLFGFTVVYKDFSVKDACFLIAMAILIGIGFQSLFYLRYAPLNYPFVPKGTIFVDWEFSVESTVLPSILLIYVIFSTFMTDIGAYFVGILFGKNKMNERISPKKTWEGFAGGIVISTLLSFALAMILASYNILLMPGLDLHNWVFILLFSFLLSLIATLGDFVFSSIKRSYGIKDYGKLIPGHGGVLDRIDSLIFAAIFAAIFTYIGSQAFTGGVIDWGNLLV